MWFKSKKQAAPSASLTTKTNTKKDIVATLDDDVLDNVLDTLASIVSLLGQHAFDTPDSDAQDFENLCEQWSRHILTGAANPNALEKLDHEKSPRVPLSDRDWKGLYRFLHRHRLGEEQAIDKSVSVLRSLVINSLCRFRQLIEEDQKLDQAINEQIQNLQLIAQDQDQPLEAVQAHILATVQATSDLFDEKNRNRDRQLGEMGIQIEAAREHILDMRRDVKEDPVTGTHNHRSFDKAIMRFTDYSAFVKEDVALLIIHVDHLKAINDALGQQAGDVVLRAVGQTLIRAFPRKDDFIARYSDEEFAVILPRTERETAIRLANRCNEYFRELEIPWDDELIECTVSIGATNYQLSDTIESYLARAEQALKQARKSGRDTCAYVDHA